METEGIWGVTVGKRQMHIEVGAFGADCKVC
jgi:hypothetical protein